MAHSKITKDHPKYEQYKTIRENFRETMEARINTWGDFEKSLKDNLEAYFKNPSEHAAAATISFYYAALLVLIDNPEEGDIKKIMEKLGDTLVFRPDICGSDALELVEAVTLNALKVLAELTKGIGGIVDSVKKSEGEAVPETTGDKPIIH